MGRTIIYNFNSIAEIGRCVFESSVHAFLLCGNINVQRLMGVMSDQLVGTLPKVGSKAPSDGWFPIRPWAPMAAGKRCWLLVSLSARPPR